MPAAPDTVSAPSAGRAYGGQPLADRVAGRRARFIEAGIEVFGQQGLRGATVRGVCAAAGLTDRYFYESFPSLEALLQAVYQQLSDELAHGLEQLLRAPGAWQGDAAERARQTAQGYALWFDLVSDPRRARIVLAEVLGVSPAMDAVYEASMQRIAELTTAPLQTALPGLAVSPAQRELLGRALVGAAIQVAKLWVAGGYRLPREEVVRTCVLVATGTMAALAAQGV